MIKVKREGIILRPTKLPFENLCTYNPGVWQDGDDVHVLYRAQNKNFISCIGYARLKGPTRVVERWKEPFMTPKYGYERRGIEDPRIVRIGDTFYVTYVAHDGKNAMIAYAYGKDLFNLKRGGIISPQMTYHRAGKLFNYSKLKDKYYFFDAFYEKFADKKVLVWEKDGILFPEKIRGKYALLHRILPDIQMIQFSNFSNLRDRNFWRDHMQHLSRYVVLEGKHGFEARHIGGGAPPIKTKKGWLLLYHACRPQNRGRIYTAAAALLDYKSPHKEIARLPYPLFGPEIKHERHGHVHNVVFPTGAAVFKNRLYIYYGAADSYVAVASVRLSKLLRELMRHKLK